MAALVQLDVPVPSYSVTAAETARALLERLQGRRLPRDLARLRFLPYQKKCPLAKESTSLYSESKMTVQAD